MAGETGSAITAWAVFSAIGGSLVGSLLGGSVSYFLQKKALKATKAQRDEDRFEVRKALAFALFIKMSQITSNINTLRKYVAEPLAKAAAERETKMLWRFVLPSANDFARISFSPEEMAVLLSVDHKLFNEMMPWDGIHNALVDTFALYRTKRNALTDTWSAQMKGAVGTSGFTEEEFQKAAPRMAELDGLVAIMHSDTTSDTKTSWELFERLFDRFKKEFNLEYSIKRNPLV